MSAQVRFENHRSGRHMRSDALLEGRAIARLRSRVSPSLQVRFPVLLSPEEKSIAHDVCTMFGQAVCGFDLLRSNGRSYVCDVNGWSFVKNSYK